MIQDSGERREFDTGAVRDMQSGKGRFDLMPVGVVAGLFEVCGFPAYVTNVLYLIDDFIYGDCNDESRLILAARIFIKNNYQDLPTAMLEVAKHFEEGAEKYGENNWKRGLPRNCYIDSAVRHFMKFLRGDTDEPHDRAFLWNLMCCIWQTNEDERNTAGDEATLEDADEAAKAAAAIAKVARAVIDEKD